MKNCPIPLMQFFICFLFKFIIVAIIIIPFIVYLFFQSIFVILYYVRYALQKMLALERIPDQTGYLVLTEDGAVLTVRDFTSDNVLRLQ